MRLENDKLIQILSKLVGLHRQLLETVRAEREALVNADRNEIHETTYAKEALLHAVQMAEKERIQATAEIALQWRKPASEVTLGVVIKTVEPFDSKQAEQLRSSLNALTVLVQRIQEQNVFNGALIQKALDNIQVMKNNVLGQAQPGTQTYTAQAQKSVASQQARLISQEA